jgi:uncharacterized membrane protein (GlpM family)
MKTLNIYLGYELIATVISSSEKRMEKFKNKIISGMAPERIIYKLT